MTDHRDASIGVVGQDVAAAMRARLAPPSGALSFLPARWQAILHSSGPCYSLGGSALLSARIYSFN